MLQQLDVWRKHLEDLIEMYGESALSNPIVIKEGLELEERFKQWEIDNPID